MEKLGYIVSKRQIRGLRGFVECVDDVSKADSTKPMLLVGIDVAKAYSKDFSMVEKRLADNVFWTYGKTEKRVEYEKDIDKFYKFIIDNILDNIKYYYINILNLKYSKIKELYNILFNDEKKYIYLSNGMLYILFKENGILGISLKIAHYCGINVRKRLIQMASNKKNVMCKDCSECIKAFRKEVCGKEYSIPKFMAIQGL